MSTYRCVCVVASLGVLVLTLAALPTPSTEQESSTCEPVGLFGVHVVSDFYIPAGERILVEDDLTIISRSTIRIDGKLLAIDRQPESNKGDGPRVDLQAAEKITISITGAIRGGKGEDHPDRAGDGSFISLHAPIVVVDGIARGGDGGTGKVGGDGGSVHVFGYFVTNRPPEDQEPPFPWKGELWGAVGGNGGLWSGNGGDALPFGPLPEWQDATTLITPIERNNSEGDHNHSGSGVLECQQGAAGGMGGTSTGGSGSAGQHGDPGSAQAPNGKPGQTGGRGGNATGGTGLLGGVGDSCCEADPNTGGKGGKGGQGGKGKGGTGGVGGNGGDAYHDGMQFLGSGGDGGHGGPGGDGKGGTGGTGGTGGAEAGPKGDGGDPGENVQGPGGAGGNPGAGSPAGSIGTEGGPGGALAGDQGPQGSMGPSCPEE